MLRLHSEWLKDFPSTSTSRKIIKDFEYELLGNTLIVFKGFKNMELEAIVNYHPIDNTFSVGVLYLDYLTDTLTEKTNIFTPTGIVCNSNLNENICKEHLYIIKEAIKLYQSAFKELIINV